MAEAFPHLNSSVALYHSTILPVIPHIWASAWAKAVK